MKWEERMQVTSCWEGVGKGIREEGRGVLLIATIITWGCICLSRHSISSFMVPQVWELLQTLLIYNPDTLRLVCDRREYLYFLSWHEICFSLATVCVWVSETEGTVSFSLSSRKEERKRATLLGAAKWLWKDWGKQESEIERQSIWEAHTNRELGV